MLKFFRNIRRRLLDSGSIYTLNTGLSRRDILSVAKYFSIETPCR